LLVRWRSGRGQRLETSLFDACFQGIGFLRRSACLAGFFRYGSCFRVRSVLKMRPRG